MGKKDIQMYYYLWISKVENSEQWMDGFIIFVQENIFFLSTKLSDVGSMDRHGRDKPCKFPLL